MSVLEHFTRDLTTDAREGRLEPIRSRSEEIARVVDILLRHGKNNPALVGPAGVGKTAIVEGLAQRLVAGEVPLGLRGTKILAVDHVALLAGTQFRGQYEDRIRGLVAETRADPTVILFIDELHNLIGQGTALGAAMDAANMLKPSLVRGDFRVIGATTEDEYERWIRGDPALERRFQPLVVTELSEEQAMEVLRARRPRLEHHHAVAIDDDALHAALVLTAKFVPDRALPDKAIDVLDEACAHAQATARLPAELEHIVKERRKVDAAIRRRLGSDDRRPGTDDREDVLDTFLDEIGPALERIGAEVEKLFGRPDPTPQRRTGAPEPPAAPRESLHEKRDRLDRELRAGLEKLGVVVRGSDVARAVGAAVGKQVEWVG